MTLEDEIRAVRDRVLADLDSAHDYYTDTKIAWRLVHKIIAAGHKFTVRNPTTGTVTTQTDLAAKARGYVAKQLTESTFQHFKGGERERIDTPEQYHRETWELIRKLVSDLSNAAIAKAP